MHRFGLVAHSFMLAQIICVPFVMVWKPFAHAATNKLRQVPVLTSLEKAITLIELITMTKLKYEHNSP